MALHRTRPHRPSAHVENGLGSWQEVRRKYIREYCDETNVRTDAEREQCKKVCGDHFCCFDTVTDGYSCQYDESIICEVELYCQNILGSLIDVSEAVKTRDGALPKVTSLPEDNDSLVPSGVAGINLPPLDFSDLPGGDTLTEPMELLSDGTNKNDGGEYTLEELCEMKAIVEKQCSSYYTPTGRLQCEMTCQPRFHSCCFIDSYSFLGREGLERSCRNDSTMVCEVYDVCKVLTGTYSSTRSTNKMEEEELVYDVSPKANAVVSTMKIEQEMRVDEEIVEKYLAARTSASTTSIPLNLIETRTYDPSDPTTTCYDLLHQSDANGDGILQHEEYTDFISDLSEGQFDVKNFVRMPFIFKIDFVYLSCQCKYHPIWTGNSGGGRGDECCLGPDAGIYIMGAGDGSQEVVVPEAGSTEAGISISGAGPGVVRTLEVEAFLNMVCRVAQETIDSERGEMGLSTTATVSPNTSSPELTRLPSPPVTYSPTQQPTAKSILNSPTKQPAANPQLTMQVPGTDQTTQTQVPKTNIPISFQTLTTTETTQAGPPTTYPPSYLWQPSPSALSPSFDSNNFPSNNINSPVKFGDSLPPSFAPSVWNKNKQIPNDNDRGIGGDITADAPPRSISAAVVVGIAFVFFLSIGACLNLFEERNRRVSNGHESKDILNIDADELKAKRLQCAMEAGVGTGSDSSPAGSTDN